MRLVFAGTPAFAEKALEALHRAGHDVALVLTQPDRPAGRGLKAIHSPVKRYADAHGFALFQPDSFKSPEAIARILAARADALVVAAYGLILPRALLEAAPHGALNIHASLLPRWRGAAPIQRALLAGDMETGISIMRMDVGLDTGPVLAQRSIPISAQDDAGTLHDKLADLGAQLMTQTLQALSSGSLQRPVPQADLGVTYARKIGKQDTVLDWTRPAAELERAVRAFRPTPGAIAKIAGEPHKVWRAHCSPLAGEPGVVLETQDDALVVACGEGALGLSELQRPGGRRMAVAEYLRGHPLHPGERLG